MPDSSGERGGREGLFVALKNTLATLVSIGKTRVELLVTEVEEEKLRLMTLVSKAVGAVFLLGIGVVLALFALALAFWEQRVMLFSVFAVLFIGVGTILAVAVKRQSQRPSKLLRASLNELEADIELLRRYSGKPE